MLQLKFYSLTATATTVAVQLSSGSQQETTMVPLVGTCNVTLDTVSTSTISSSNLTVGFVETISGSFGLIEVLIKVMKCAATCLQCLNPSLCLRCAPPLYFYNF